MLICMYLCKFVGTQCLKVSTELSLNPRDLELSVITVSHHEDVGN